MKSTKKTLSKIAKTIAGKALNRDANSTTCISFYQPKAPTALKKYQASKK